MEAWTEAMVHPLPITSCLPAGCRVASCRAASTPSPPSNPFAWHAGHIIVYGHAGVTIAALGQPVEAWALHRVTSNYLPKSALAGVCSLVGWPPGDGKRGTR